MRSVHPQRNLLDKLDSFICHKYMGSNSADNQAKEINKKKFATNNVTKKIIKNDMFNYFHQFATDDLCKLQKKKNAKQKMVD